MRKEGKLWELQVYEELELQKVSEDHAFCNLLRTCVPGAMLEKGVKMANKMEIIHAFMIPRVSWGIQQVRPVIWEAQDGCFWVCRYVT